MERWFSSGRVPYSKSILGKYLTDKWLMEHPYKKALIIDTKGINTKRWYEPTLQIESPNENRNTSK